MQGEHDIKADTWRVECEASLCEKCSQMHKKFKALQSHQILPIINHGGELVKDVEKSQKTLIGLCEKHEERYIELVCDDHQEVCCALCIVNEHKYCEQFSTFSEAAEKGSDETKLKLAKEIKHILSKIKTIIEKEKTEYF